MSRAVSGAAECCTAGVCGWPLGLWQLLGVNVWSCMNTKQGTAGSEHARSARAPQINNENAESWDCGSMYFGRAHQLL